MTSYSKSPRSYLLYYRNMMSAGFPELLHKGLTIRSYKNMMVLVVNGMIADRSRYHQQEYSRLQTKSNTGRGRFMLMFFLFKAMGHIPTFWLLLYVFLRLLGPRRASPRAATELRSVFSPSCACRSSWATRG